MCRVRCASAWADFVYCRLSDDDIISINRPTTACANAVNYIVAQTKVIQVPHLLHRLWLSPPVPCLNDNTNNINNSTTQANLDGKNAESFLEELGLRLQK